VSAWLVALLAAAAVAAWVPAGGTDTVCAPGRRGRSRPRPAVPWAGRRETAATQAAVLEVCDLLAAELAAGRPAGVALASAAERWPPLDVAVEAARLGADVPDAMRRLAH